MQNVYTVKQVNAYIKNMFLQDFMLSRIYLKGEVSNCKYHTSGHLYFSLKDASGAIACVMFAGQRGGLSFRMQNGQQVVVLGGISTYERDGTYQLYAKEIRLDGAGLLYEKFQALKTELEEMGMFAAEYKQEIPKYASKIGVVTAPTGAAIQDIRNIASRRNPFVQLILYPALVQGEGAAASIVKGILALEQEGADLLIVGRGGGSIEDLWAFNEEEVARAIFECRIPIISAVGHESDTTIADFVADLRAPTPSAAAELAIFEYQAFDAARKEQMIKLGRLMQHKIQLQRMILDQKRQRISYLHPRQKLRERQLYAAELQERLGVLLEQKVVKSRHRLAIAAEKLRGLSPASKLSQGFSFVENREGSALKSVQDVSFGMELSIYVMDGTIRTKVTEVKKGDASWQKNRTK